MKEYRKRYPILARETTSIIKEHKPILSILKSKNKEVRKTKSMTSESLSLKQRLILATRFRNVTFQGLVRVLDGKPLKDVTPQQRKAFLIQEELKGLTTEGLFDKDE